MNGSEDAKQRLVVAILVVSDRAHAGVYADKTGPALREMVEARLGNVTALEVAPDDEAAIQRFVRTWSEGESDRGGADLLLTAGGTGLGPRDMTPEAVGALLDKPAPGLMELARLRSSESTPLAYLSRGVAGVVGRTLVVTLPGSPRGASEQLEAIADVLPHAVKMAKGGGHG